MGIKGIYRELGPGQRISLAKLATDHLESTGQPLRLAIDIAIWQFQTQAARGGTNPAIRTLFYRLVRLLGLAIHPIFVFDGPHKPAFKRNKRSGRGDGVATAMAKRLIRLFGFPVHDSPGEAEAECALLQQHGIVDAVLSEDVDTIMFGCTRTLRNWTSEGTRGAKTPTHVSMYDVEELLSAGTGLDREGMVLVALMSGGDYIPEGVPGCGVKLACEAAKAGFGKSLCRLKIDDSTQFEDWKTILKLELRTNDSGFFRTKHKALSIPEEFPNRQVLRHYTHPVVSNADTIDRLKTTVKWNRPIDVQGLRYFVDETFDWVNKIGAIKLTRVLSQGLLVHKLLERYQSGRSNRSIEQTELEEAALIKRISGIRSHHSTDGTPELRVVHIPADTVGLDMSQELEETVPFDRQGLALNSDDEYKGVADCDIDDSGDKAKARNTFDPLVAESIWLPETLLKLSVPLVVEDWEEKQRTKVSTRTGKGSKKKASKPAQERGALDKWVQITKSTANMATTSKSTRAQDSAVDSHSLAPFGAKPRSSGHVELAPAAPLRPSPVRSSVTRSKQSRSNGKATAAEPTGHKNPWAFAGSQHMPRITKSQQSSEPILLSSSPLRSSPAPSCTSLISASPGSIIDLSGPDHAWTSKPSKPRAWSSVSRAQRSECSGRAGSSAPVPPLTPPKNRSPMKQTRMDSFITNPSRAQPIPGDILVSLSDNEPTSPEAHASVGQAKTSAALEVELAITARPRSTRRNSAVWIDDDDEVKMPRAATQARSKKVVPRRSAHGFFKVIDVSEEEDGNPRKTVGHTSRSSGKSWRQSGISVIDLTGDD